MTSKKAKGKRAKTRRKLRRRGPKATVNKMLQDIKTGATVDISIDSSVHSGMPSARYHGYTGKVTGKRGAVYEIDVKQGKQIKQLVTHPAHLAVAKVTVAKATESKKG